MASNPPNAHDVDPGDALAFAAGLRLALRLLDDQIRDYLAYFSARRPGDPEMIPCELAELRGSLRIALDVASARARAASGIMTLGEFLAQAPTEGPADRTGEVSATGSTAQTRSTSPDPTHPD
ncbi:MAG TPA: hypothetical protein PKE29_15505 [Phycisphaerales bacterium]|nr:hypothetical protein [Phycisphaerales bacterium]